MVKKKSSAWEQSSQVKEIMENNKPVWIKETRPCNKWERCVQDYFERDKERWKNKRGDNNG